MITTLLSGGPFLDADQLEGNILDFYVAQAKNLNSFISYEMDSCLIRKPGLGTDVSWLRFNPSKRWMQGGPIIENENISVEFQGMNDGDFYYGAYYGFEPIRLNQSACYGPSPLVAAMKTFVKEWFGKQIDTSKHPTFIEESRSREVL